MDDYLPKPIKKENLMEIVYKWGRPAGEPATVREWSSKLEMEEDEFLEMANLFLETSFSDLNHLQDAQEKREALEAVNAAHSIKGAAAGLGLTEIYQLAKAIETKARENQFDQVPEWIRSLREKLNGIAQTLRDSKQQAVINKHEAGSR